MFYGQYAIEYNILYKSIDVYFMCRHCIQLICFYNPSKTQNVRLAQRWDGHAHEQR